MNELACWRLVSDAREKFIARMARSTSFRRRVIECALVLSVLLSGIVDAFGDDQLPPNCGKLRSMGQYGPFDYRTATPEQKSLVEGAHFEPEYAAYLRGKWIVGPGQNQNAPVAGGLDYTLRAFPNHYRALQAMDEMGARRKMDKLPGARFGVECYFLRGVEFVPQDGLVRALFGRFLARRGRAEQGRQQLAEAIKLSPDDVNVRTLVASSYIEMGDLDRAEENARVAYQLGYPLPGLRDSLKAKGHWSE